MKRKRLPLNCGSWTCKTFFETTCLEKKLWWKVGAVMVEVYFDDFKITHTKSPVIESQDFYPFGLTFNKYSRENSVENRYLYNQGTGEKTFKTERITELDLNVDQSKYRTYDYLTGRWWQVDPKADQGGQESWSTYQFGFNNPIRNNDPEGDIVFAIPLVYYAVVAVGAAVIAWQAKRTIDAAVSDYKRSNSNSTSSTKADPTTPNSKVLPAPAAPTVKMPNGTEIAAPGKGKGSVAKEERDPKRVATQKEKKEMLDERGNKCEGCDKPATEKDVDAHHEKRHSDGGSTTKDNLKNLCEDCHKEVHKQGQKQQPQKQQQ
jgi:RHS repeat-associated protein